MVNKQMAVKVKTLLRVINMKFQSNELLYFLLLDSQNTLKRTAIVLPYTNQSTWSAGTQILV